METGRKDGPVVRGVENDALIESSFRRLLAAIESEHEKIRGTWSQMEQERECTTTELMRLRQETDDWCYKEQQKIDAEWQGLNKLVERMNDIWPVDPKVVEINCSKRIFVIARSTLRGIPGSMLDHWFSDEYIRKLSKDSEGRILLDLNPICFGYVVDYLQNRRLRADAPTPIVPHEHQENMDYMAEALRLYPFLRNNRVSTVHGTSLVVNNNTVVATHPGWQIISSAYPLTMSGQTYVQTKIVNNPDASVKDAKGSLAFGICGHVPTGKEVFQIRLDNSAMYVSGNGLISDIIGQREVTKFNEGAEPRHLEGGSTVGILHDAPAQTLTWFYNGVPLGSTTFKKDCLESLKHRYPVWGLYIPDQTIQVDFKADVPRGPGAALPAPPAQ